ncbi:MAG: PHP domain-containing protein [Chlamydiota bacterium]
MFRADLHCHTSKSDGSLTPSKLLTLAKEIGLSGICITDHDTIDAYAEAIPVAKELGLILGAGVEFSCSLNGLSIHVLGYDFDLNSPAVISLCSKHHTRRIERLRRILERLNRLSFTILEEELQQFSTQSIGRPHIAQLMVTKGYVKSIREAFLRYLGDGMPCYEPGETVTVADTLDIIHQANGKAFIAHPHLIKQTIPIKELLKLPFDGIECYYAKFSQGQERKWVKIAKERGLLISGGSDFHGDAKDFIPLGCSWVDEETFHKIFQKPLISQ